MIALRDSPIIRFPVRDEPPKLKPLPVPVPVPKIEVPAPKIVPAPKPLTVPVPKTQEMSFLGIDLKKVAATIAPKIIKATTVGGTSQEKELLKKAIDTPVFKPVFEKFGRDFETGTKIAGGIAATAATVGIAGPLLGGAAGAGSLVKTKGMSLLSNILPAAKDIDFGSIIDKGFDLLKNKIGGSGSSAPVNTPPPAPSGFDLKSIPWWAWAAVAVFLFGKQLKKLLR